jgi:outer membrane biosynthesis protein TonB
LAVFVAITATLFAQGPPAYVPPRFLRGDLPPVSPPNVIAGGEVLIEAIVDQRGALTRPVVLRSTPPFTNMVLDAIGRWSFKPAEAPRPDNSVGPVEAAILIAAVYRPPQLTNGPTLGEPPKDISKPSTDVAYPVSVVTPSYPPQVASGLNASVVLYEVSLDERGKITTARAVASDPGFDDASHDALMQWNFRPSTYRGRPAPAVAYVLFGFAVPVLSPPFRTPGGQPLPPGR